MICTLAFMPQAGPNNNKTVNNNRNVQLISATIVFIEAMDDGYFQVIA